LAVRIISRQRTRRANSDAGLGQSRHCGTTSQAGHGVAISASNPGERWILDLQLMS
jgi:hypothetical protein